MALFSRDDYNWMAQAWVRVINTTPNPDREVVIAACYRWADLLEENSPGFDRTRFISNIRDWRPTKVQS